MQGELSIFICSHIPMEIFFFCETGKKWENQKSCLCKGRLLYLCVLLRFRNTLRCPSLLRTHSCRNLPYNMCWLLSQGPPPNCSKSYALL
jgi:hypothetical protein